MKKNSPNLFCISIALAITTISISLTISITTTTPNAHADFVEDLVFRPREDITYDIVKRDSAYKQAAEANPQSGATFAFSTCKCSGSYESSTIVCWSRVGDHAITVQGDKPYLHQLLNLRPGQPLLIVSGKILGVRKVKSENSVIIRTFEVVTKDSKCR